MYVSAKFLLKNATCDISPNLNAYQMMRVSVGLDDGFHRFSTIEPIISADLNGDGVISAFDAYHAFNS